MSTCERPVLRPLSQAEDRSVLPADWRAALDRPDGGDLGPALLELLRLAATRLPDDVVAALARSREAEAGGSRGANTLDTMLANVALAEARMAPLCQDTGTLIFWVRHPYGLSQRLLRDQVSEAVAEATRRSWLRPNCVAAVSGANPGNNLDPLGEGHPVIHFEEWDQPGARIDVMLKGGGCENVGAQYRLPDVALGAGRDLKGVRKCIIDAVVKAQGFGCSPGVLGVAIGGDRVVGYERSKALLLRKVGTPNPDPALDALERQLVEELNTLGIGPMGYGGATTVLGVFLEELWRHPASFFVSLSYMCWNNRRMSLSLAADGAATLD